VRVTRDATEYRPRSRARQPLGPRREDPWCAWQESNLRPLASEAISAREPTQQLLLPSPHRWLGRLGKARGEQAIRVKRPHGCLGASADAVAHVVPIRVGGSVAQEQGAKARPAGVAPWPQGRQPNGRQPGSTVQAVTDAVVSGCLTWSPGPPPESLTLSPGLEAVGMESPSRPGGRKHDSRSGYGSGRGIPKK
jgi:hypothetical protein